MRALSFLDAKMPKSPDFAPMSKTYIVPAIVEAHRLMPHGGTAIRRGYRASHYVSPGRRRFLLMPDKMLAPRFKTLPLDYRALLHCRRYAHRPEGARAGRLLHTPFEWA